MPWAGHRVTRTRTVAVGGRVKEVKGLGGCGGGRTGRTRRVRVRKHSQASGASDWVYAGDLPWGGTPGRGRL